MQCVSVHFSTFVQTHTKSRKFPQAFELTSNSQVSQRIQRFYPLLCDKTTQRAHCLKQHLGHFYSVTERKSHSFFNESDKMTVFFSNRPDSCLFVYNGVYFFKTQCCRTELLKENYSLSQLSCGFSLRLHRTSGII